MALTISKRTNRLAKLVTGERKPCAFCLRELDDEVTYGKLYAIGDIQCHYFCCLLSCCLIQKGHDEEGLFGFMYADILAEVERCKKHKCSYCGRNGANLGCSVGACRKQFHLPCGREKNAISLYYGTYKSYCQQHAPRQKLPDHIMANARLRMKASRMKIKNVNEPQKNLPKITTGDVNSSNEVEPTEEMVCVICYETVDGFPTIHTFWPPCCARDAWFHRTCLQRMALSAGMHYLKCPLCNDKENFYEAVVSQGYYVPDRDAAWELEQNAFAEIYERPVTCSADECTCPNGREHDAENGQWDIKLCLLCGSAGIHAQCLADQSQPAIENANQSESSTETDESQPSTNTFPDQIQKTNGGVLSLNQSETDKISDVQAAAESNNSTIDQSQPSTQQARPVDQSQLSTQQAQLIDQSQLTSQAQPIDQSKLSTQQAQPIDQPQQPKDENTKSTDQSQAFFIRYVCRSCMPAAPKDLSSLANRIEAIIQQEQATSAANSIRPVMPSRMSLRRTKGRIFNINTPSSSRSNYTKTEMDSTESPNVRSSRQDLNLKTPRKPSLYPEPTIYRDSESKIMSPVKLLEQSFKEKVLTMGVRDAVLDESVIETLRRKFRKPRPLCEKKKIVNNILDGVFDSLMKDAPKQKETIREWCSPKKTYDLADDYEKPQTEGSDQKSPEVNKNKENYFHTRNTPLKEYKSSKDEANAKDALIKSGTSVTADNYDIKIEENIQETPIKNIKEKYRKTRNSLSKIIMDDKQLQETNSQNMDESGKKTRSQSLVIVLKDRPRNIDDTFAKNIKDNSRTSRNSFSKEINKEIENKINKTPTKSLKVDGRKTSESLATPYIRIKGHAFNSTVKRNEKGHFLKRNSFQSTTINSKTNSKTGVNSRTAQLTVLSENKESRNTEEKSKITRNSKLKRKKSLLLSKKQNRMSRKNAVQNSECTYSKILQDSKHGDFLRKLLTEEDLCAKLLSELTRNENYTEENDTPNKSIDSSDNAMETINSSKHLMDIDNDLIDSPSNLAKMSSPNKIIEQTNSLTESSENLTESPNNSTKPLNRIMEIPKCKTIDIQQDSSLEIFEKDQSINIDVIKINDTASNTDNNTNFKLPVKNKTCAFKTSPYKEVLKKNIDMDFECFKREYLNEVDRELKCNLKNNLDEPTLQTAIDSAADVIMKKESNVNSEILDRRCRKRKISESGLRLLFDKDAVKKRKVSESDLKLSYNSDRTDPEIIDSIDDKSVDEENKKKIKRKTVRDKRKNNERRMKRRAKKNKRKSTNNKNIEVTIDSTENRSGRKKKIKKKIKTKFEIRNENNIRVKIKWKKKQLSLNIESKKKLARKEKKENILENSPKFKQYVLQFHEGSSKEVLMKPEKEVSAMKRKYVRHEKSSDNLKQMSLHSFFKVKSPET